MLSFWEYMISMLSYILILFMVIEVMRKNPKFSFVFWLLALLTFPFWIEALDGWFRWVKTLSVLVPTAILVGFGRIAYLNNKKGWWAFFRKDWLLWSLYGVLFLNIAEATIKDFSTGHYWNALSGVVLCITIPIVKGRKIKKQNWKIENTGVGDVIAYTSPVWNILYTTWNLALVFGENPSYFASSFCILFVAEMYPVIKKRPELYIIARIYTLAFHLLIRACYDVFTPTMNSEAWANPEVLSIWGLINGLMCVLFLLYWTSKQMRKRIGSIEASSRTQ